MACFGCSREGNQDVRIFHTRTDTFHTQTDIDGVPVRSVQLRDGTEAVPDATEKFLPFAALNSGLDEPHWNPVLFPVSANHTLLFFKVGAVIRTWRTMVCASTDQCRSFSDPVELVVGDRGGRGPVRNKPLRLSDGAVLAPASLERGEWTAFADRAEDDGGSWTRSGDIHVEGFAGVSSEILANKAVESSIPVSEQSFHGRGIIQPTLWESTPGRVHMLLRSSEGRVYRSDSEDGGRTWSSAYPTTVANNNSGIDLVRLHDGRLLLVHNPIARNWGPRTPLVVSMSADGGSTW